MLPLGRVGTFEYAENVSIATPRRVRVANERLRSCITGAQLTISDVAAHCHGRPGLRAVRLRGEEERISAMAWLPGSG
jgi:hypothetical protein